MKTNLNDIQMNVTMNKENQVTAQFYRIEGDKKIRIDLSKLDPDDKKYAVARYSILLHKIADNWQDVMGIE